MAPLLAGKLSSPPIYAQVMRGGVVGFYNADNESCWSDPRGRSVVSSMDHARALLDAHGYALGAEIVRSEPLPEGSVAMFTRFNVYTKGNEPVPPPSETTVLDELTKLRESYAALEARCRELEGANAKLSMELATLRAAQHAQGKGRR